MSSQIVTTRTIGLGEVSKRIPYNGDMDPLGVTKFYQGVFDDKPEILRQGFVITYNPSTHSALVQIAGFHRAWSCVFSDEHLSYAYGYSETHPPREGEYVLVLQLNQYADAGVIIGRMPFPLRFDNKGDLYQDPDQYHRRLFTQA